MGLLPRSIREAWPKGMARLVVPACLCVLGGLSFAAGAHAQSAAEWNQMKAQCGLPSGTIYNDWVAQGAPCSSGSASSPAANPVANAQQQMAAQVTIAGAQMLGQALHEALFGKPETEEQRQARIAAQQLNNTGVWYLRKNDYANAIVEFQKALERLPNDSTIRANLTLARRLQEQASRNGAAAGQNSDALSNVLGAAPAASRPSSWNQPENMFQNIDVNFTSNTVDLRNAPASAVDPAKLKKDDPTAGHPLDTKEGLSDAFDQAVKPDTQGQGEREQLNSEFDKLTAPAETGSAPAAPPKSPTAAKKAEPAPKRQPGSTNSQQHSQQNSQEPAEKP